MTETVPACPECDSLNIRHNSTRGHKLNANQYRCARCGLTFDTPNYREKQHSGGLHGLAGVLDEMDPDDLSINE